MSAPEADPEIVAAALRCYGRCGIAKTTMEDVAREAGISRATLYRQVASKDALLHDTVQAEARRLLAAMADVSAGVDDVVEMLALALHRLAAELGGHEVLNKVLDTEPQLVLRRFSVDAASVLDLLAAFVGPPVRAAIASGRLPRSDPDATVEYVCRMVLSFLTQPGRGSDIETLEGCRDLVSHEILGAGALPSP